AARDSPDGPVDLCYVLAEEVRGADALNVAAGVGGNEAVVAQDRAILGFALRRTRPRGAHTARAISARRRALRARSQRESRARSRRTSSGSIWRPGRCMFASATSARSSALSAIHFASTSSASGRRWLP